MATSPVPPDVRRRSKQLFGNSYMLELCAALGDVEERTNLTGLIGDSGLAPSLYSVPLQRLKTLGLLIPAPKDGDNHRERWVQPARSMLWAASKELLP